MKDVRNGGGKMSYFSNYYDAVRYPRETNEKKGLRQCQLGAIHAIASHFTNSNYPAIITMPTGSGKTAILMLSAFVLMAKRVLVLTPSRLVRSQIQEEFKELQTLLDVGALTNVDDKPKVYELKNKILTEEAWMGLRNFDVVVATPMSISPAVEDIPAPPDDIFDLILIDEAHHSPAATWNEIIEAFPQAKKILFTATPFRRDRKEIKGKFIYNYSISDAYKDGVFGKIKYIPVENIESSEDITIAKKAESVFIEEKNAGFEHCLMVRTDRNKRAKELEKIYAENTSLRLKTINSDHSYSHVKSVIKKLNNGELDGIICVNMLGEGFNFPKLKIAAIHSPHKSLEVTLQFIGRFARTNAPNLGVAKFIATPSEIEIEREKIYEEGAVWQEIIMNLSESRIDEEVENKQTLSTFNCVLNRDDETKDLSLASLVPFAHVIIYSVDTFNIDADVVLPNDLLIVNKHISREYSMVVIIAKEILNPKWTRLNMFQKIQYELFLLYFHEHSKLLFISSTRRTEDIYENLAEQFSGIRRKLPLSKINRVLTNLKNPEFFNIGMRNSIQTSNTESYRIIAGPHAQKAIRKSDGRLFHRGHCFGKGIDENREITIGYSSGSKVWSNSYLTIPEFIKWCNNIANKVTSKGPTLTNSPLDYIPISEEVNAIPDKYIISVDWNSETYENPPIITIKNSDIYLENIQLLDYELQVKDRNEGVVEILFRYYDFEFIVQYSLENGSLFRSEDNLAKRIFINRQYSEISLLDYLNANPLVLYFSDFSSLIGHEYYRKNYDDLIYIDENVLEPIKWEENGVDIECEFGEAKDGKISIQDFLNKYLSEKDFDFLYYDHGTGEIADFITAKEYDNRVVIQFYHCKSSGGKKPGDRVEDVYEVCGQVIKSSMWTDINKLRRKLKNRMKTHEKANDNPQNYIRDSFDRFLGILASRETKLFEFEIILVQPGITKSGLSEKISSVLAATDDFCVNQGYLPIRVFCSE